MIYIRKMTILIVVLTAHLLGDLFLRVDAWMGVHRTIPGYLAHSLTWASIISIALVYYQPFSIRSFLFLFGTHFIIDVSKYDLLEYGRLATYLFDQSLHLLSIIIVLTTGGRADVSHRRRSRFPCNKNLN